MIFIIMTAIIIYVILIAWTWQSLGFVKKSKKIAFIIIGLVVMYIITSIAFQIAQSGITYENTEMKKSVKNILVAIFAGLNGLIAMPQIGKTIDKVKEDEIEKKAVKKRMLLLGIVFVVCLIIEVGYMKDTQIGILKVYEAMK